jgi:hypothetical protein
MLTMNLGRTHAINRTELIGLDECVYRYSVEVPLCPCAEYATVVDRTENRVLVSAASPYTDTFGPVWARCLRLVITGSADGGDVAAVREFSVFASPDAK